MDINIDEDASEDEVTYTSYKGNHEDENYSPTGSLPYDGKIFKFYGTVSTRGL